MHSEVGVGWTLLYINVAWMAGYVRPQTDGDNCVKTEPIYKIISPLETGKRSKCENKTRIIYPGTSKVCCRTTC